MWQTLREFGPGHSDLRSLVRGVAAMLRLVALRIDRTSESIPASFYVLTAVSAMCYVNTYLLPMVRFVQVRCRETSDLLADLMVFAFGTTSCIGITKLVYMFIYREKLQSIVADLIEFDKLPVAPATRAVLAMRLRAVKKRALVFGAVIMGNGFIYTLRPLFHAVLKPGRYLMYEGQVLYGLEPMLETPNYQIALVTIIISVTFICFIVSTITALLIISTGYSEARLLALSQELMSLWADAVQHYKENFDVDFKDFFRTGDKIAAMQLNKYVKHRLQGILESHATNVNLVKKVNDVYSEAIAAEFVLLMISLIAALLGGLEHTFILLPFAVMQVSMDCFTGQRLMDASQVFEAAVYECKWENFDAPNMKTVQVMLLVSQRTLNVSAGGVATLSYGCLMWLIKSVYSAYMALRSSMQ